MPKQIVKTMPEMFAVKKWPKEVFPNDPRAARYFVRKFHKELSECGAMVRIGRDLVIIGVNYAAFLKKLAKPVEGWSIAPNHPDRIAERRTKRLEKQRFVIEARAQGFEAA